MRRELPFLWLLVIGSVLPLPSEIYGREDFAGTEPLPVFGGAGAIILHPLPEPSLLNKPNLFQVSAAVGEKRVDDKPPFPAGKVFGCIASGVGAGGLLGGMTGLIGYGLFHDEGDQDDVSGAIGFIVGGLLGYTVGNSFGVYLFGNLGEVTGSYKTTFAGSVLGLAVGGIGLYAGERIFAGPNGGSNDKRSAAILFAGPPLASTAGFYWTRRYDSLSTTGNALVNVEGGKLCLAVPIVSPRSDSHDSYRYPRVPLVRVMF